MTPGTCIKEPDTNLCQIAGCPEVSTLNHDLMSGHNPQAHKNNLLLKYYLLTIQPTAHSRNNIVKELKNIQIISILPTFNKKFPT
jgi:hypothetical protein